MAQDAQLPLSQAAQEPLDSLPSKIAAYARFWAAMSLTVLATIVFFTGSCFGMLMPRARGRAWMLANAVLWGRAILWASRCPLEVVVEGKLPEGGFLIFANHQSILDIPALFVALEKTPVAFAAKRELYRVPLIGWYLAFAGFPEVDRSNRRRAMESYARAARQIREEGVRICVYPEGTRSEDGSVLPFKKGAFVLAIQSQAPIVPLAIEGAQKAVRKHTHRLHGHAVRIRVGEPIPTAGLTVADREELLVRTRKAVLALHRAAGGPPSVEEPMVAPPGKPGAERDA